MTTFRSESRSVRRFVGLPSVGKVNLWPTVDAILAATRADNEEIGDQIVLGALNHALIESIVAGRYFAVHDLLGKLLGLDCRNRKPEDALSAPSAANGTDFRGRKSVASTEMTERRPREHGGASTVPVSDATMRAMRGASKLPR